MQESSNSLIPKKGTVYVVDDDEAVRDSVQWLLEGRGYRVRCFDSAESFLSRYDAREVACLLVDIRMGAPMMLVAFVSTVIGGLGSLQGAVLGGLLIGVVESLGGLLLGESLGQVGIFVIFIVVLLLRPQGFFGAKA